MDISLDIFKKEKIKYDWKTMYVGLKLNLINYNDITNYAVEYLSMHPETSNQEITPKEDFNPSQYSKEENIVRLINFFNDFLKRELQYLQSDNNI